MLVGGLLLEQLQGVGHAVAPVAQHLGGRGPGPEIRRAEHFLEQIDIDDVVALMQPEHFQHVMLDVWVRFFVDGRPTIPGGD